MQRRIAVVGLSVCLFVSYSISHISCWLVSKTKPSTKHAMKVRRFSESVVFHSYSVICISQQCVCVFVTTEASLLAGKGNNILSILEIPVNECRRQQAIALYPRVTHQSTIFDCTCVLCATCERLFKLCASALLLDVAHAHYSCAFSAGGLHFSAF